MLNNQQLEYPTQVKNRESLSLLFCIFSIGQCLGFFPLGASFVKIMYATLVLFEEKSYYDLNKF